MERFLLEIENNLLRKQDEALKVKPSGFPIFCSAMSSDLSDFLGLDSEAVKQRCFYPMTIVIDTEKPMKSIERIVVHVHKGVE